MATYIRIKKSKYNDDCVINLDHVKYIKKSFYMRHKITYVITDKNQIHVAYGTQKTRDKDFERISAMLCEKNENVKQKTTIIK